jgi:hypothetical protein
MSGAGAGAIARRTAIHNARVQMFATALNNLGVASIVAGVVAPMVNGTLGDFAHVAAWIVVGGELMAAAQLLLGRLR